MLTNKKIALLWFVIPIAMNLISITLNSSINKIQEYNIFSSNIIESLKYVFGFLGITSIAALALGWGMSISYLFTKDKIYPFFKDKGLHKKLNLALSKNTVDGLEFTDDEKNRFREYVIQRVIEINEKYKKELNDLNKKLEAQKKNIYFLRGEKYMIVTLNQLFELYSEINCNEIIFNTIIEVESIYNLDKCPEYRSSVIRLQKDLILLKEYSYFTYPKKHFVGFVLMNSIFTRTRSIIKIIDDKELLELLIIDKNDHIDSKGIEALEKPLKEGDNNYHPIFPETVEEIKEKIILLKNNIERKENLIKELTKN